MEQTKNKTLYFLKLQANHFQRKEVRILEGMSNGALYSLFYLKLCLESLADNGYLRLSEEIPYSPEMLSAMTNTNIDIVRGALSACEALGLIQVLEDQTIYVKEVEALTGQIADNPNAERQRRFKARQKVQKANLESQEIEKIESVTKSNAEVTPSVTENNEEYRYIDTKSIRKEREKEREKKSVANAPDNTHEEETKEKKVDTVSDMGQVPSFEEVKEFIHSRGDLISAKKFFAYYCSIGWPLADWKSRVEYWEEMEKERATQPAAELPPTPPGYARDASGSLYLCDESEPDKLVCDPEKDLSEILGGGS